MRWGDPESIVEELLRQARRSLPHHTETLCYKVTVSTLKQTELLEETFV